MSPWATLALSRTPPTLSTLVPMKRTISFHGEQQVLRHHEVATDIPSFSGNCRIGLYCDAQQKVCMNQKDIGVACQADKECV